MVALFAILYLLLIFLNTIDGNTIDCSGNSACSGEIVTCNVGEPCTINCSGDNACQGATLECAAKQTCNVNCIEGNSNCRYAIIKATESTELWLSGCGASSYQCYSMELYCPPQQGGNAKCHITGGDAPRNFDFWNINGFSDLDMSEYTGSCYGCGIGSYMKCLHDYSSECQISDSDWACDPSQPPTICNDPPIYNGDGLSNGLSTGWIFIIILVSLLFLYCLAGYLYNGKKHQNWKNVSGNIPNYSLWKALPSLTIAGCSVSYEFLRNLRTKKNDSLMKDTDIEL